MEKNSCLKFMSLFDQYATSFQINFQFKTQYQSTFGGIISLIIYIILIFVIVALFVYLLTKSEQKLSTYSSNYDSYPEINITTNYKDIKFEPTLDNSGYFIIGLLIKENNTYVSVDSVSDRLSIHIRSSMNKTEKIEFENCLKIDSTLKDYLKSDLLNQANCPKINHYTIKGDFDDDGVFIYETIRIELTNETESIRDSTKDIKISILYSGYSINNDITAKKKSPIIYSVKTYDLDIITNMRISVDMFLKINIFESRQTIWSNWGKKYKQKCIELSYLEKNLKKKTNNSLIDINLRVDKEYLIHYRSFFNFLTYLSYIGGIWKVLIFLGALIAIPMNSKLMNVALSNRMYNMINPENKEIYKGYKYYKDLEFSRGQTPDVFKSLNPVLYKICIDYYKYERNRGLNFTVKEALSKMFCCCCKIESVDKKDKIFKLSSKELQKIISTNSIGQFAQQDNRLTSLKLKDEQVFFNYISTNTILYKNLDKIFDKYNQQQINNSASPLLLTYNKQCNLVDGFNTMRNKGDLTKEDILTLGLFNINYDWLKEFFLMYSDRLELIHKKNNETPK